MSGGGPRFLTKFNMSRLNKIQCFFNHPKLWIEKNLIVKDLVKPRCLATGQDFSPIPTQKPSQLQVASMIFITLVSIIMTMRIATMMIMAILNQCFPILLRRSAASSRQLTPRDLFSGRILYLLSFGSISIFWWSSWSPLSQPSYSSY